MTTYQDFEFELAKGLNALGYYRQTELQKNIFYQVEIYSNILKRYDQLQVELLHPHRNEAFTVGIEIKNNTNNFLFRASFYLDFQELNLHTKLVYYSNSLDYNEAKSLPIAYENHEQLPKDCLTALNRVFLEELNNLKNTI